MRLREDDHRAPWVEPDRERIEHEQSTEEFDRVAFAMEAMDGMPPRFRKVAVHETGAGRGVHVDEGSNWAVLSIDRTASRRAITHAIAAIARQPIAPWSLAVLDRGPLDH